MDPYSQLKQLHKSMMQMTKTTEQLENKMLETLKENTELKVENRLLREKLDKVTTNKREAKAVKSQSGLATLRQIYNSGYHICNMYYGSPRDPNSDCMFCLDILDNFGEKKKQKRIG